MTKLDNTKLFTQLVLDFNASAIQIIYEANRHRFLIAAWENVPDDTRAHEDSNQPTRPGSLIILFFARMKKLHPWLSSSFRKHAYSNI